MVDSMARSLEGRIAVVTGGTKGVGLGVVEGLLEAGATVYYTGRSASAAKGEAIGIRCDHTDDAQVEAAFARILDESGAIDVLVNAVWGGYENMVEHGQFTWPAPFWQQPRWRWTAMFDAGVRASFVAAQLAAASMVPRGRGLIVQLSYWAARKYLGNAIYGAAKAATDKLTADMAYELKPHGVAVVSLYPGLVRTERVLEFADALDLSTSESPCFTGRAVAALAADRNVSRYSGSSLVSASLARNYGFTDIDGKLPPPLSLDSA
jgi:NAD(P)-dependent dehydrogenase (short-subunit alcohol dehydrogenase family)